MRRSPGLSLPSPRTPDAPPQVHSYIDAFLTVYWFAMDQPDKALQASKKLALEDLPAVVGAEIAWALSTLRT